MRTVSGIIIAIITALATQGAASADAHRIEDARMAFAVEESGSWELLDKSTNEVWRSNSDTARFATVIVKNGSSSAELSIDSSLDISGDAGALYLSWSPSGAQDVGTLRFTAKLMAGGRGVRVSWEQSGGTWKVTDVRFPDSSFRATKDEGGYLVVANRMGIIVPAGENTAETKTYPTYRSYGGCSMAMAGSVKNGSAVLLTWEDPYCVLETKRSSDLSYVEMSVLHKGPTGFVTIRPVGKGGYVEIAKAYREVARERGLLVTFKDKWSSGSPIAGREYFSMDGVHNRESGGKRVFFTFPQVAATAEHMKNDVGIDKAMVNMWGWQLKGYDRHPDILPAAPECGGNAGLIDCAKRVRALGYLFGLRDCYQDIYEDSASWDPSLVMKNPDGSLVKGGVWAGAQSYVLNTQKGFELAKRSQNIPGVKKLVHPDLYYIDTVQATPLFEDFSKEHSMTLRDDMYWKSQLCKYARKQLGIFGTEEGVEWGVPFTDFTESLMTRTKNIFPTFSEVPVPLFEMVYGDCVQFYQGDRTLVNEPGDVLDNILCAEMPMSWLDNFDASQPWCEALSVARTGPTSVALTCNWRTYGKRPRGDCGWKISFVDPARNDLWGVAFTHSEPFVTPTSQWPAKGDHIDGPITIDHAELAVPQAGDSYFDMYMQMTSRPDGTGGKVAMRSFDDTITISKPLGYTDRCNIGCLKLSSDGSVSVSRPLLSDLYNYARCDTRRDCSYRKDGLILNTYKICSPLNRMTANTPMTNHVFLTSDRLVQRSEFGDVVVTVNYGSAAYRAGDAVLPQYGFLVECPQMVAFRAISYAGRNFSEPTLAVLAGTDGKPISESDKVDTYRAYGDKLVTVAGRDFELN